MTDLPIEDVLQHERPRLFGLAYRMLGSAADADDVLQEAFVRVQDATAREPAALLTTVVTRLCLDVLKSAPRRREAYVGPWFPEPIATDQPAADERLQQSESLSESLSMAFVLLLDALAPMERAAFVLREVLDTPYADIASVLDKSESACRQLVSRARVHMASAEAPVTSATPSLAAALVEALARQDTPALVKLLRTDVTASADHGGKAVAIQVRLEGAQRVSALLLGLVKKAMQEGERYGFAGVWLNQGAALLFLDHGHVINAALLDVTDGQVARLWMVRNPDKLARLDGDLQAGRVHHWS